MKALAQGTYPSASAAARACVDVLRNRPGFRRSFKAVKTHIVEMAARRGIRWVGVDWSPNELQVIRRHACALQAGKFPSGQAAALACLREMGRLPRSAVKRPLKSVCEKLMDEAHARGLPRAPGTWSDGEMQVLKKYVRALIEGRYRYVHEAVVPCTRELGRLGRRVPVRRRGPGGCVRPRTKLAIRTKLLLELKRLAVPRFRSCMTEEEAALVERYARAVDRGEFDTWKAAARACRGELQRLAAAAVRRSGIGASRWTGHTLIRVHQRVLDAAHRLNLRGPRRRLWTEPEWRICKSWARWYGRYRGIRRLRPRGTAAAGMQEELEQLGILRSLAACRKQLVRCWRRSRGLEARDG